MDLTDAQWAVLESLFRPKRRDDGTMGEVDRGKIRAQCSTVSCGSYAQALLGTICLDVILPTRPVIAVSSSGSARDY